MSPVTAVIWATSIVVVMGMAAAVWSAPEIPWFWFLILGAMAWFLVAAALGIPALVLLSVAKRSRIGYVTLFMAIGAAIGAGVGAANGLLLTGTVLGGAIYAATAFVLTRAADMETNNTVDTDARKSSARGSP